MKKILVIGKLDPVMHSFIKSNEGSSDIELTVITAQTHLYEENSASITYVKEDAEILDFIYNQVKVHDVIYFNKLDSETSLKMVLAAMAVCDTEHLIILQYAAHQTAKHMMSSSRLQRILRASDVKFSLVQIKNKAITDEFHINCIQNHRLFRGMKLSETELYRLFKSLIQHANLCNLLPISYLNRPHLNPKYLTMV